MAFTTYATPNPLTRFSAEYFAGITVAGAASLVRRNDLPVILPKNSIKKWVFDKTVPTAIFEMICTTGEALPCLEDMLPITQEAEVAFNNSDARSVCIQLGQNFVRYHFSKVSGFCNILLYLAAKIHV
jgi:hypothetical protein